MMTDRTLKSKVFKLQELQAEIDELTAQADIIKDQIKAEMTVRAVDELEAGNTVVRWKPVVSSRFDAKAFREAHNRLYEQFAVKSEVRKVHGRMSYQAWLQAFLDACNADMPIPVYQWSREDFPTINLRAFYDQGFTPARAAVVCKAINHFTKPKYLTQKESPLHLPVKALM